VIPYLFGLEAKTGRLKWKLPMITSSPVVVGSLIAVLSGHRNVKGEWDIYSGNFNRLDVRLEIIDPYNGLVACRSKVLHIRNQREMQLVASGHNIYLVHDGELTGYRVG
jgi:hypothetical protein